MSFGVTQLCGFGAGGNDASTAPTFGAKGTAGVATATPVSPTYPAGISANNLLILAVCIAHSTSTPTVTAPTGYTLINEVALGSGTDRHSLHILYKIADGTETGALAVTIGGLAGANVVALAQIYRISGVNAGTPYESNSLTAEWTATWPSADPAGSWTSPTISPGGNGRLLVIITGFDNDGFDSSQNPNVMPAASWTLNAVDSTLTGGDASIRFMSIAQATTYTGSATLDTQTSAADANDAGDGYSWGAALIGL